MKIQHNSSIYKVKTKQTEMIAWLPALCCFENHECKYSIQKILKHLIKQFYNTRMSHSLL